MPYEIYWHIDKRVIGTRFYGEVIEADLSSNGAQVKEYIQQGIPPLFFLVDTRDITQYPTNLKDLLEAMGKNPSNSNNLKWTFVVSNNRLINFMGTIAANIFHTPIRMCKTREEAETYIAIQAPELADLLPTQKSPQSDVG